ncbi:hypothetical protein K504DRAFT_334975, partial [Pleomassaria siparia CBS 279.74]
TPPTPLTWTLRFKAHKTTVLLHTDPLTTFATIKAQLHAALQETQLHSPDTGAPIALPSTPSAIQLGRARNPNDAGRGFVLGEWEDGAGAEGSVVVDDEEEMVVVLGKGKGKAAAGGKRKMEIKDCPKGAGLRDGAVLAFRWLGEGMWDGDDDDEDRLWGVKFARLEDTY